MSELGPPQFDPLGPLEPGVTLLEASAGTGKTYSITSLFVRLVIEKGFDVDEILAVTFTQAATAELTSRIRKRLGEAHRALLIAAHDGAFVPPDPVLAHLVARARAAEDVQGWSERARAAVEAFDRANITTIHGFCQRMLAQHALEAQVPFGVELIEDQAQLIQEIADDFWVREVAKAEPWELQTLATIGVDLESLRRLARLAVHHWEAVAVPAPDGPSAASGAPAAAPVQRPDASDLVVALEAAADAARAATVRADIDALQERIRDAAGYTPGGPWKQLVRALDHLAQNRLIARDLDTLEVLDHDTLRMTLRQEPLPPIVHAVTRLLAAHKAWRPRALPWALAIRHALVAEVRVEHDRRAKKRGVWSYDDLLRSLASALTSRARPDIAAALKEAIGRRFRAVLIDEFQDTDPVQWTIFETVFAARRERRDARRAHHLYLIGDPKQAIYGFRRADVMTYLAAAAKADRRFTLTRNYRSDRPLVEAMNLLFERRDPTRVFAVDGIPYRAVDAEHGARVEGLPTVPPMRLLWVRRTRANTFRSRDFTTAKLNPKWGEEHLPAWIASDIVRTLAAGITLGDPAAAGGRRALAPSDCAVLVHKNEHAVAVKEALGKAGVPAVVHGPRSVFETDEAKELHRVLTAVLDPSRMQNVRAALLTRLLGVTAIELARLEADAAAVEGGGRSGARELEAKIDRLREWRDAWTRRSFIEAFRKLTSDRVDKLLELQDGELRLANHLQLGELLHLAVAQKDLKPPGLVAWLERQIRRADKTDDRQQVRLETDEPAVQVVTIHKAKGLEYAFVWCPFLWQKADQTIPGRRLLDFVYRDARRDADGNVVERVSALDIGLTDADPQRQRGHRLQVYGEQSERLRGFYVALTRAKHQVTMVGGAFADVHASPLGYVLLSGVTAHDAESLRREAATLERQVFMRRDDEMIDALGQLLPKTHLAVEPALPPSRAKWKPPGERGELTARPWDPRRRLDVDWRRTSFSGLVQERAGDAHGGVGGAGEEARMQAASDEDRAQSDAAVPTGLPRSDDLFLPATPEHPVLLAELPSGRAIGNCLHKILERADFGGDPDVRAAALAAIIAEELAHYAVDKAWAGPLLTALSALFDTPLDAAGLRLSDLSRERRLPELAFVFPVAGGFDARAGDDGFSHASLVRTFRTYGGAHLEPWLARFDATAFAEVRGFMSGSLDLAFQSPRDQRWYIVDWKSNHLGKRAADYALRPMREAMDHHHYHLQHHLYAVALCRYLRARLGDAFDVERDFGGALYLFLRGMHPDHPLGTGVYADRPSASLVTELDRLLRGERGDRAARGASGTPGPSGPSGPASAPQPPPRRQLELFE